MLQSPYLPIWHIKCAKILLFFDMHKEANLHTTHRLPFPLALFLSPLGQINIRTFMAKKITDIVTWVGKVDWELNRFHGDELSTHFGSSYNAYLIQDEKTALIDTVWQPFDKEFVSRLAEVIDLHTISYIVMLHNEIDQSGALPELLRRIPNTPIYCTKKGEAILRGHYHQDWNFVNVKTGDTLSLGKQTLTFIEAPMLHWPDTMMAYLDGEHILFSNDVFGQHYATESLYDSEELPTILHEAEKYYANIVCTYSPMAKRKLAELLSMQLPISLIAPSHGVIWKDNIPTILQKYQQWSTDYQENQITIVYDTMWNSTRLMAEAIAEGIQQADSAVRVRLFNASKEDKNDILTEIFRSKAVLFGSPTINYGISFAMAGIMEMVHGMKLKGKRAAAFGSYGWSGDAVKILNDRATAAGFTLVNEGIRTLWVPNESTLTEIREFGTAFTQAVKED